MKLVRKQEARDALQTLINEISHRKAASRGPYSWPAFETVRSVALGGVERLARRVLSALSNGSMSMRSVYDDCTAEIEAATLRIFDPQANCEAFALGIVMLTLRGESDKALQALENISE